MKILYSIIIQLILLNTLASATDYYISSTGNDSNNGLSSSTPWQSITKVNSVFATLSPGDRILFKRGDIFKGTLVISRSGLPGFIITIGAYGSGNKPVITGFSTLAGWTNEGNGIYSKVITSESDPNMVVVDGVQYGIGRFPNNDWLSYESYSSSTSITDAGIGSGTDWDGAEIVIRKNPFVIDRGLIINHTGDIFNYKDLGTGYYGTKDFGYFIQNDKRTLDRFGEWFYNKLTSTFYMYFGNENPALHEVSFSSINSIIRATGSKYITLDNISVKGSIKSSVYLEGVEFFTIQNCDIDFSGQAAIECRWATTSSLLVNNNHINHSNGTAIQYDGKKATITNNLIENSGLIIGASNGDLGNSMGIRLYSSDNTLIQNNRIINTSNCGVFPSGNNVQVKNNYIENFCANRMDGGGIYTSIGGLYSGIVIEGNIILNGKGSFAGMPLTSASWDGAEGIYLDAPSSNVTVKNNTVANCNVGIKIHESHDIIVEGNLLYDNRFGVFLAYFGSFPGDPIRNVSMTNNLIIAKQPGQLVLFSYSSLNDLDDFGTANNNYYARPIDDNNVFYTREPSTNFTYRNLAGWKSYTRQDAGSLKSPIAITNINDIRFEFNDTDNNKVVTLQKPMIDIKGAKYANSITLLPHTSVVLLVDPNPAQPVIPVYVSSVVENASPTLLTMTYSLSLDNIIPPASAFIVLVNSISRKVNSVAIVGGKVQLTLESAVVYGDVVTVSYTSPPSNPLQKGTTGIAESISGKAVTNNCLSPVPVYVSSVIENATPAIVEITYSLSLANIVPAAAAFSVLVNSALRTVNSVAVTGGKVQLNLASPVKYGDVITVSYTKPATNPLQTAAGGQAESISGKAVTNNYSPVKPVYISSVVENANPSLLVITYDLSLANIVPAASAFNVLINGAVRGVNSVAISATKVQLTLSSAIRFGDIITVSYTKPATTPLQTAAGGQAESISARAVANNYIPEKPVYTGSAVENATPSIIDVTYNLSLANIVPAVSAFTVQVNSVARTVNSVALVSGKVRLTLASPIVFGNLVTISYTRPAVNQLQTSSGGVAESVVLQPVTNKCQDPTKPNMPPVAVIRNETNTYGGFVGEIDASGSYDPDNDILSYDWIVPGNIAVSSISGSKIKYLSPVVTASQSIEFQVKINDGKTVVSKNIPVTVTPYKPESDVARITTIEASSYQSPDYPNNVSDGSLSTKWSMNGDNQWLLLKLAESFKVSHLEIGFLAGQKYSSYFDIYASGDNISWEPVVLMAASCSFSGERQVFEFPLLKSNSQYSYLKLVGHGNSVNKSNNIAELKIYGSLVQNKNPGESGKSKIVVYPNPVRDFFNISIEEPSIEPDLVRIIDLYGKIVFESTLQPGIKLIQIPGSLNNGTYILELRSGSLTLDAQKLIIYR